MGWTSQRLRKIGHLKLARRTGRPSPRRLVSSRRQSSVFRELPSDSRGRGQSGDGRPAAVVARADHDGQGIRGRTLVVLAEGSPDALRAADNYAVIRLSSGARLLSPAADARDLFRSLMIAGRATASSSRPSRPDQRSAMAARRLERPADLEIADRGRRTNLRGRLICGS